MLEEKFNALVDCVLGKAIELSALDLKVNSRYLLIPAHLITDLHSTFIPIQFLILPIPSFESIDLFISFERKRSRKMFPSLMTIDLR